MDINLKTIKEFIRKHHLDALRDVAIFILITVIIHFAWRFWAANFNYAPIRTFMYETMDLMAREVYRESARIISVMYEIDRNDESMQFYFPNQCMMYINESCSGLKQMLQFSLLLLIIPGPWKKKLWFIPLGVLMMHLTNLFRVTGLAVVMMNRPEYWNFSHDYIFRPLFYVVIFALWLIWVEKMAKKKKQPKQA
jgi:exosortase family protein XrtF